MPGEPQLPAAGAGTPDVVIDFPADGVSVRRKGMATDLPDSVAQLLMVESTGNIQAGNALARQISQLTNGALQAQVVQDAREVGLLEGRTASGVLGTAVAGPTNPAPKAV
jgi:hypothetical protein